MPARGGPARGRGRSAPPQGVLTPRANSSTSTTGSTATNPTPSPDPVHGGGGPALSGRDHINTYEVVTPLICVLQVYELLFFYGFEGRGHVRPGGTDRGLPYCADYRGTCMPSTEAHWAPTDKRVKPKRNFKREVSRLQHSTYHWPDEGIP